MAGKKPAPAKYEEFPDEDDDAGDSWDDSPIDSDAAEPGRTFRMRDWRDVEKYREMKELRQLVDEDDMELDGIFEVRVNPRDGGAQPESAPRRGAAPAKGAREQRARPRAAMSRRKPVRVKPKRR